jgi:lipoate-protein ligase A
MRLHLGATGADEATELAIAHALVRRASAGEISEAIRVYRPMTPAVVFGRRDTRLPGFAKALDAALSAGFQPAVRAVGGRAVAYTPNALIVDHVRREPDAGAHLEDRFVAYGDLMAATLRELGVDARVGAVPGEYCPGAHSVNAGGVTKLVGTAQRVVRDAWLFSTLITVGDDEALRPVLADVYGHLGLAFDPASVGSVRAEAPAVDVARLEVAIMRAYGVEPTDASVLDEPTIALAKELRAQHALP